MFLKTKCATLCLVLPFNALTSIIIAHKFGTVNIKIHIFCIFSISNNKGVLVLCTLDKILALIKKNNIKQKDLTDYLGISKNAFTNWKGGFSQSYNRYLPQIAEFFNVSIDYLAGREQEQEDNTIIPNDALNPKIQKIKNIIENKNIPDDVIDFIYRALETYK